MEIRLYGTEHCHLCDEAEQMLRANGIVASYVEILGDEQLRAKYRLRIPVLQRMDSGAELGWPFDARQLLAFLS